MKKMLFFVASILLISSCSGIKRLQRDPMITTNPTTVNLTADGVNPLVDVNFQLNVPKKYVPKRGQLVYQPQFLTSEYTANLEPVVINGKKMAKRERKMIKKGMQLSYPNAIRIDGNKKPISIDYDMQAPYFAWMPESELIGWTLFNTGKGDKEAIVINRQVIAEGVAVPMMGPGPVRTKEVIKEVKAEKKQTERVYFVINSDKYDKNLTQNSQNEAVIKNLLEKINTDKSITVNQITIIGSASPDGTSEINSKLAANRANVIKSMLETQMGVMPSWINVRSVGADWSGFKTIISNSSLSNKSDILKIADSNLSDWQKSEKLRMLPNFKIIKSDILPQLRNVTCEVEYVVKSMVKDIVPL